MHVRELSAKLSRLINGRKSVGRRATVGAVADEPPLRAELFTVDQLRRHATLIAGTHQLASGRAPDQLLSRLDENERVLIETYDLVTAASDQNRRIEPAAEWLLDNFYLVEDQIRAIRRLLPPSYSRNLPRLAKTPPARYPRVYTLALELITHVDGRIDAAHLDGFISAYQSVQPLKLGELWALPLMLRLALIENLRRVANRLATARRDRDLADSWAQQMIRVAEQRPADLILVLADMARAQVPLSGAFISELTRQLQGQNPNFAFASIWLEHRLTTQGVTSEQLVRAEGQAQAADQVSIGNSINSLRFLSSNDWREFVDQHSQVEQALANDPAGIYAAMDFATRDRYRHAVEAIARRSRLSEVEVAEQAVQLAQQHARQLPRCRAAHVGYYLIDRGRAELERLARMRLSPVVALDKLRRRAPLTCYLGLISLITVALMALLLLGIQRREAALPVVVLLALAALVVTSHLAVAIVNWVMARLLSPQSLPRMNFERAIPAEHRTLVVVPTMLTSPAGVEQLVDALEVRYLANRQNCLHFGLLTDWADAPSEHLPEDAALVRLAREGIERLNEKYGAIRRDIFYLFHRRRLWNAQEGIWMGYERKRGKLGDLNALLRGAEDRFVEIVGQREILSSVRYVITLDTDTQLPRDAARWMVGTLAHPLNRPVFDEQVGRVVAGYTILQPRVDVSLPSAQRSRFAQLFAEDPGVDPYTRVVSDVYQDLFGEGSFIGKGIYEVDAFERYCSEFPENAILSHDLIEGAFGRSGLLSDVTLYEEHPSRYTADTARRHRWIRGDWQIAPWLLPKVPGRSGRRVVNPLSALSRWKIFDNLRRSLVPVAMLALLLGSWCLSPAIAAGTLIFLAGVLLLPSLLAGVTELVHKPIDVPLRLHLRSRVQSLGRPLVRALLTLVFLPHEAYVAADAVLRTWYRMGWSKRRLLQWTTASDVERALGTGLLDTYRLMPFAPAVGAAVLLGGGVFHRAMLPFAGPFALAWLAAPLIAWWLSQPRRRRAVRFTTAQQHFLEKLSRTTWRYFEELVSAHDNWLPPDNIQQNPDPLIASRTSPTNIGMGLLAELAAYDFGYQSAAAFLERTERTLTTLMRMERYRGHFYNWYDTRTLAPLHPRYVSMVDSGNLLGNLRVLSSGCLELSEGPVLPPRAFGGLEDTLRVLLEATQRSEAPLRRTEMLGRIERQLASLNRPPRGLAMARKRLALLRDAAADLIFASDEAPELTWWAEAYHRGCQDHCRDLLHLAPWLTVRELPERLWQSDSVPQEDRLSRLRQAIEQLDAGATLPQVAELPATIQPLINAAREAAPPEVQAWLDELTAAFALASERASARIKRLQELASQWDELAEMDFRMLYNDASELFAIGYNVSEQRLDSSCYDLLASEARLGSFVVIAQGEIGQEHWFSLGRLLTTAGSVPALLSWSGSMFEYLMPLLVMPNYEHTLLDRTYQAVVRRQIEYGQQRKVPWGISESGYNTFDQQKTYQYRAFGVPGLGLKRGLLEDLVIAPYASVLALMVAPEAACQNLQRLTDEGQQGEYGFYEAIDYTPSRLPPGTRSVTVRQFMAHHEGMSLLSLAYVLLGQPMQRRFLADPTLRAAELLLQERIPTATAPVYPHASEARATRIVSAEEAGTMQVITDPHSPSVEAHLLSNGRYHVVVTSAGGGYSRWHDLALTRWREDATRDHYGSFCYLRDVDSGAVWSTAWHPTGQPPKAYEAIFTQARAEFRRRDDQIETYTQISVSPEDDIELRRVTLTNRSERARTIEITSYCEVVLAPQAQDEAHPAFSNLFVQTQWDSERQAIYCTRRPRSAQEHPPWMMHMMKVRGKTTREPTYETDRMRFIGRQRTLAAPLALEENQPLSKTQGPVLDPIASIRHSVSLQPGESVVIDIFSGAAETRAGVEAMTQKYQDLSLADRIFDLAWTHSLIVLQQLGASDADAQLYGRLASSIIYASALRRAKPSIIRRNRQGQSGLWGYGISGDLPIVLVRVRDPAHLGLVQQVVQAHAYWRLKGLVVDLMIWNEDDSVYRQSLQEAIVDVVAASPEATGVDRPGGVFIRRGEQMSEDDRALLQSVARIVLLGEGGTLAEQTDRRGRAEPWPAGLKPLRRLPSSEIPDAPPQRDLAFFNGLGGFSHDGREYVTLLAPGQNTPAPWVNVIANPQFGTVVSEGGGAYTWAENSHAFRLTPWHNDPVSDLSGEAFYIRDEASGYYWSPSPSPARGKNTYIVRHGFGYSIFDYTEQGLTTELMVYVSIDSPVKFYKLKVTNHSGRARQLSVTGFWELVLGDSRSKNLPHVVTEHDPASGAILARNVYSPDFGDRVAFVNCSETLRTFSGDRTEFIGRNGNLGTPAALGRVRLSGRLGAGYDPCAAFQTPLQLGDGQTQTITFTLGAARSAAEAKTLAQRFRGVESAQRAIEEVWAYWSRTLGVIHLETPDASVNFLANGWLLYQTLACRMWARSGFYQSGGAYGFRDQLQDSMALIHAEPQITREHLLRAAARQFREGDVQHWWHPPTGRGVRTHFSDDYLWLPLAICRYVNATGDTGVLEERVPYLTSRLLRDDEESNYDLPQVSDESGTLYEHGLRALDRGLRFGRHGLPLMGCGDWNDGMNLVGQEGKGESVWLGFFLFHALNKFTELARRRGDTSVVERYTAQAQRLRENIERHGWDGQWYRRAYFDDGTPLGSAENDECQIDAISQSWSVLSGAGPPARTEAAMQSLERRLVRRESRLILLLDPPFDKSPLNPGYIKGYVPGVRENGGQYTHSAIWATMAAAARGDGELAWELFSMINPISHGDSAEEISTYRVEPYVVAADVYGVEPHTGRGGWTWYTGSAAWLYRLIIESLLGVKLEVDKLRITPCLPETWKTFQIHYRYRETFYHITIHNPDGDGRRARVGRLRVDGNEQAGELIPLVDDRQDHHVEIELQPHEPASHESASETLS